jgi:hypothetical protein
MLNAPNTVLNCIIIDKSQAVRNDLARFCNKNDQLSLCGTYESLNSAQKECNYAVDLVLLDWDDDNANDLKSVKEKYAEDALDNLIAGKAVAKSSTKSVGCSIKWKNNEKTIRIFLASLKKLAFVSS